MFKVYGKGMPIKYDDKDIVIQTPKLFIPFNISCFNCKRYLDLSFQNIKNDKNVKVIINNKNFTYIFICIIEN